MVEAIEAKIHGVMGIDPLLSETIQGQRYAVGQQFKPHHDFFHVEADYWPEMARTGGQRTWTAMVFLNEPDGGGETFFEKAGVRVTPRRGNMLAWNNLDERGPTQPLLDTPGHAGDRRGQVHHHQMVSRAALDRIRGGGLLILALARSVRPS